VESAHIWILSASLAGDRRGLGYLPSLEAQLTAEQLARAKQRARELQATPHISMAEMAFVQ
jgi:hypothetical protein